MKHPDQGRDEHSSDAMSVRLIDADTDSRRTVRGVVGGTPIPRVWSFDSRLEEAHEAAARIRDVCGALGYCDVEMPRIELCVYEAFVNAVEHAYGNRSGHEVKLTVAVHQDHLRLQVCQRGVHLCPDSIESIPSGFDDDPDDSRTASAEPPEVAQERGRGLRIIKLIMDRCEVARDGDWSCLVMVKALP